MALSTCCLNPPQKKNEQKTKQNKEKTKLKYCLKAVMYICFDQNQSQIFIFFSLLFFFKVKFTTMTIGMVVHKILELFLM